MTQSLSSFITDTHLAFSGFWDTVTSLKPPIWGGVRGDSGEKGKPPCTISRGSLPKLEECLSQGQGTWWQPKGWSNKQFLLLVAELVSCASCVCLLKKEALTLRLLHSMKP